MSEERFIVDKKGSLIDLHTRKFYDYVFDVVDLLNTLYEENQSLKRKNEIRKQCCANSHNAHQFLNCYEKAINDLDDEYEGNPIAMEVLEKLDEYYDKYERMVELE